MRHLAILTALLAGCGGGANESGFAPRGIGDEDACGESYCPLGFHCEFDACVADEDPTPPAPSPGREDPLASQRFVFSLEREQKRLVRIDSATLSVKSFAAGLAPMDLGVVGGRELSILLDALDLVEVLDHRQEPPLALAFTTARALSHLSLAPSGTHALAYFDWDDGRAQERQPEPGNINQVSVLFLGDVGDAPMSESDPRLIDVAVGFLPRDVRFAADGSRAVVLGKDTLTPIDLVSMPLVAIVQPDVRFDAAAAEVLLDAQATTALLRYSESRRLDVVSLDGSPLRCLEVPGPVLDAAFDRDGRLIALYRDATGQSRVAITALAVATPDVCTPAPDGLPAGNATTLVADTAGPYLLAYRAVTTVEELSILSPAEPSARLVKLEKAVGAVAFAGDGRYAVLVHLKTPGTPAWDPGVEDPELSVDKAHGASWLDLDTGAHRLAVSDEPFGPFSIVPAGIAPGATFLTLLDAYAPQLLRVTHAPGFDDAWVDLAALPLATGFLSATSRVYVTQEHPWGRVTFLDPTGGDLRHVTGFALSQE